MSSAWQLRLRPSQRLTLVERRTVAHEAPSSRNRMLLVAHQLALDALDLLFPPHCVGCGRVGSLFCQHCLRQIAAPEARACTGLDAVCVAAAYDGAVSAAIKALKYDRQTRLAEPLGLLLANALRDTGWQVDIVVPIPLHPARNLKRGYNQAKLVSLQAAQALALPVDCAAVNRVRDTPSQVNLNAQERRANMQGAFEAQAQVVAGKSVLVVDDVLTTGATLSACAAALRLAGAARVYGATVAGAVFVS